jgi:hypothetical protein
MSAFINKNGRIVARVIIKSAPKPPSDKGMQVMKELICDGASPRTIVPASNLKRFFEKTEIAKATDANGKVIQEASHQGVGKITKLAGATMDVEVEKHGGGDRETRTCSEIWVHSQPDDKAKKIFDGAVGLLGMDQFDNLRADPVKSADGKKAYLAKRV